SCLEWFACFDPVDGRYVNFEMNSNGALLSAIGAERNNRVRLDELIRVEELPPVVADKTATKWSVTITVSKAILEKIYGHPLSFKSGFACKGNLYKCGDETPVEHYVMWNPVETKQPDYHVPAFFGDFIMG
ncbi:MAG TPA: hypothetical protein DCY74_04220, partial [Clostridiales bacterium]|nr:hypothetical protein [Clostridiales bacterium]